MKKFKLVNLFYFIWLCVFCRNNQLADLPRELESLKQLRELTISCNG